MSWNKAAFKEKLIQEHRFPGLYLFKFIVPMAKADEVLSILPEGDISNKPSKNNNYISITLKATMGAADDVIEVYERAYLIDGIIAL